MSASVAAAKLAGRAKGGGGGGGAAGTSRKGERRSSRRRDDDDLDALLNGTSKAEAAAEEQFPTSRGLLGNRRAGMR